MSVRTTMFYDGSCPLCRREVDHYRRLDRAGRVDWADIAADASALESRGVTRNQGMQRLHALDAEGHLVSGAWAFAAIWQELPGYRWLARTVRALHLLPAIDWAYRYFARWRFARRCADGACRID